MSARFTKFQGYGNDYLVFEAEQLAEVGDLSDFARRVCNRHYGAGADGIAIVSEPPADRGPQAGSPLGVVDAGGQQVESDFSVRIFNPDGSEAGMSGNGTRCAASYLFYHQLWSNDLLRLQTRNGIKRYHILEHSGGSFLFRSELSQPKFDSATIPMLTDEP